MNQQTAEAPITEGKKSTQKPIVKIPIKQDDIWEDYKQIYLDFSLNNDQKVKDRVLFVNSFDADFNPK